MRDVIVSVVQTEVEILAAPCGGKWVDLTIANQSSSPVYTEVRIETDGPIATSHELVATYLPANDQIAARVQAFASANAKPGTYPLSFSIGGERPQVEVPVTVVPRPTGPGANLALGGPGTASSTHGNFSICGALDGDTSMDHWASYLTGWNDGTRDVFPDWFEVDFPSPARLGRVVLYTLDSPSHPGTANALRDWDVQIPDGSDWKTVASVRGNQVGQVTSSFTPVVVPAFRILCLASNDAHYSRIVELEAYAE